MRASDIVANDRNAHAATRAFRILDRGARRVHREALGEVVRAVVDGELPEIARDRNAICYRAVLAGPGNTSQGVIVKTPRPGPQRTNPDATFAGEAFVLARLSAAAIAGAPELLARVAGSGSHFLFTSELPGRHPHPARHPLDGGQVHAILDALYGMDRQGFMHYDLKAANVLTDGHHAAFIDFEFARFGVPWNADTPAEATHCEDFNVAGNPFVRARSNVANFEFRCLHRYLLELSVTAPDAARSLFRLWLHGKCAYHARMAGCLSGAAAAYERSLAALFSDPSEAVTGVEWTLMAYRSAVFERDLEAAAQAQRATMAAIAQRRSRGRGLPRPYADAAARVIGLVARSVHPAA